MILWHNGRPKRAATAHLFVFSPWGHPTRRQQELCLYLRVRRGESLRHYKLGAYYPRRDLRVGPRFGMLSLEGKTWLTDLDERSVGCLKTFVRLKVGIGGWPQQGQRVPRHYRKRELDAKRRESAYR
jgi:hypothetical protein